MGAIVWDVVQNQVLVCVQWGDDVIDDVWNELGDTIMEHRSENALLPVIIVSDGRGPTRSQQRRFEQRFHVPVRLAFMTRASATMETAQAIQSPRAQVAIIAPGDYLSALIHLRLPDALVSPIAVTVSRLNRELRIERLKQTAWEPVMDLNPPRRWARVLE